MKVFWGILFLFPSVVFSAPEVIVKNFSTVGISRLDFRNIAGNATINVAKGDTLLVQATKIKFQKDCRLTIKKKSEKLFVEVKKRRLAWWGTKCEVNFEITIPEKVRVDLKTGAGMIKARLYETPKLVAKLGAGNVDIHGLSGNASVKVGSGSIKMLWSSVPTKGSVDIKLGSGSVKLSMPKEAKIKTLFKSGVGNLTNELGSSKDSKFKITTHIGAGNLQIKKN